MNTEIIKRLRLTGALIVLVLLSGCGWVHQGISECPAQLRVKFVYDYNMKSADAFRAEVNSINLWVFDSKSGALVWSGAASGQALADESGFEMEIPVEDGTYDFVAWGGLSQNSPFALETYTPSSKEQLAVTLQAAQEGTLLVSDTDLGGLYNGTINGYNFTTNPDKIEIQYVTVSLTKDTNAVRVLLQNLDGHEIKPDDFTVSITDANSNLSWNNNVLAGPVITYQPWMVSYGATGDGTQTQSKAISTVATLLSEMSMSRLIAGQECWLTVTRNNDGVNIIQIPLIEYLLLIKGHYGTMTDQEYLDRQDDYTLMFILDSTNNWYVAGGIHINSWVVVPPQNSGNL